MKFLAIFVATAVFFSDVAVARPSRLAQRVAARTRRTNPKLPAESALVSNSSNVVYSPNWSGAVIESPPSRQTFNTVIGTFTVPKISGSGAASAWVGIDGATVQNSILQAGVDFESTSYTAWTEWYPNYAVDVSGFSISAGDQIQVQVHSTSSTAGTVTLKNLSKRTSKSISLNAPSSSAALQGLNAEWIVEDFKQGGSLVPFANFGTVTFTGASARTSSGSSVGVSGATLIDIEQNGKVLTTVTIESSSSVQIKRK